MKKPLIGVTPSLDQETKDSTCRPTYLAAIRHAGGIPVILPLKAETEDLKQLVETLDGFLFTGGPDIHPFYFREETHEKCGNVSPGSDRAVSSPSGHGSKKAGSWHLPRNPAS